MLALTPSTAAVAERCQLPLNLNADRDRTMIWRLVYPTNDPLTRWTLGIHSPRALKDPPTRFPTAWPRWRAICVFLR